MTEPTTGGPRNGADAESDAEMPHIQAQVLAQYIKDLSFENPNIERLLKGEGDAPNLNIDINVGSRHMGENLYESVIHFSAQAVNNTGVIYEIELAYAGLMQVEVTVEEALEPFLLVNAPSLLFPFLRRLLADITREGGFPPLLLDPIDFSQLYLQRREEQTAGADSSRPN